MEEINDYFEKKKMANMEKFGVVIFIISIIITMNAGISMLLTLISAIIYNFFEKKINKKRKKK